MKAIYPYFAGENDWHLEYQLTLDTVFVDFDTARALARDSAWKRAFTRASIPFIDNGRSCMVAESLAGCLPFRLFPPNP